MRIGVPKERKTGENRVALTPAGAHTLVQAGHLVTVETEAGLVSGFSDTEYTRAGARIGSWEECWRADLVVKVKEPVESEVAFFRKGLLLFSYLHLAANRSLTETMVSQGVTALAYETLQLPDGSLPLLIPMSEVAGRVAVQAGAHFLENAQGGSGILLGGVPGVPPGRVVVVGGGTVGTQAARIASGMGAEVLLFDQSSVRLRFLDDLFGGRIRTAVVTPYYLEEELQRADLAIGAVLVPGARAPKVISREMIQQMRRGSVVMDISIDQGGCVETVTHPTTHDDPVFSVDGILHYAVGNIPSAVPRTSTFALTNATLPWVLTLASAGIAATETNPELLSAINTMAGEVTCPGVAEAFGWKAVDPKKILH
ncbi:alanine dehydrogenase [Methylacidimicrobium cyclopophantes]|uniref:Alanine dehydrogenase n=1 Tax=Methylacidimicrobium cyclopophantes TaxID=1041766 RepID=A0A5E6MCT6_9BACT|nr:alanine dehydrogenase [Methylacidimicrobium cyclopophantes]VVM07249.1 alanine dehydrogenase [Methylacidimicrobium cyclopophantes]